MWRRDLGGYAVTFGCIAAALLSIGYSLLVDGGSTVGFVAGLVAGHFAIACILAAVWSTGRKHLLLFFCSLFFLTAHGIGWATGLVPVSQAVGYTAGMIVAFLLGLSLSALAGFDLDYRHRMGLSKTRTAWPGRNTHPAGHSLATAASARQPPPAHFPCRLQGSPREAGA